jgi:hypothetical protein
VDAELELASRAAMTAGWGDAAPRDHRKPFQPKDRMVTRWSQTIADYPGQAIMYGTAVGWDQPPTWTLQTDRIGPDGLGKSSNPAPVTSGADPVFESRDS